mgnify:CR=1 FL=1
MFILMEVISIQSIIKISKFAEWSSLALIIFAHFVNCFFFWVYFYTLIHTCVLGMSSAGIYVEIISVKLKKIANLLSPLFKMFKNRRKPKFLLTSKFEKFYFQFISTLVAFCRGNKMFGRLFLAYLLVQCPCSALMTMFSVHGHVQSDKQPYICALLLYQYFGIFGVHLFVSLITKQILNIGKTLMQMIAKNKRDNFLAGNVKTQIRCSNLAMLIWSTNYYAFTYGCFGNATINSFSKAS